MDDWNWSKGIVIMRVCCIIITLRCWDFQSKGNEKHIFKYVYLHCFIYLVSTCYQINHYRSPFCDGKWIVSLSVRSQTCFIPSSVYLKRLNKLVRCDQKHQSVRWQESHLTDLAIVPFLVPNTMGSSFVCAVVLAYCPFAPYHIHTYTQIHTHTHTAPSPCRTPTQSHCSLWLMCTGLSLTNSYYRWLV